MKITPDINRKATLIRSYGEGHVVVVSPGKTANSNETQSVQSDIYAGYDVEMVKDNVVVMQDKIVRDLLPASPSELSHEHFQDLIQQRPELIIVGTGQKIIFPDQRVTVELWRHGIGIEVMDTAAACRTYNYLIADERHVFAALFMI